MLELNVAKYGIQTYKVFSQSQVYRFDGCQPWGPVGGGVDE